jgi:superoxide dismutase, Fe-Mn family
MAFKLPKLPYAFEALEPHISRRTLEFHYGKHHKGYVDKLNELVGGKSEEKQSLEDIMRHTSGAIFNNAAQVWNHHFYWKCLSPDGGGPPPSGLSDAFRKRFGGFDDFKAQFTQAAASLFGSGYVWLVLTKNGTLEIVQTKDAANPLTQDEKPLLTCDVWEHAYYLDYQNLRARYIEAFWDVVNWEFVDSLLNQKKQPTFA